MSSILLGFFAAGSFFIFSGQQEPTRNFVFAGFSFATAVGP